MTTWDPDQYLRYAGERERPFFELIARVPVSAPAVVVDLGCGPGRGTAELVARWPGADVVGIDNSEEMIASARAIESPPRLTFHLGDIVDWDPEPETIDVIVSNATLHWVRGHLELFPRWLAALRSGGALALQVPGNFTAPSHALLDEISASPRWRSRLGPLSELVDVVAPERYFQALSSLGAAPDVWETTYLQALRGVDPVYEWVRGSALRPYLHALGGDAEEFAHEYRLALRDAYPPGADGVTLFPFRRVFVVALRP